MTNAKKDSMTEGSLTLRIIKFIIPIMLTGILQLLYNAADSVIVGNFDGKNALAAVSSVGSLINLIVNVSMGLTVGTSVAVAHDYGAKDYEGVQKTVHTSYLVAVIAGVAVGIFGVIFSRTFLVWMGSPDEVLPLSTIYLRIYFIGMPANLAYNFGASILRSVGDAKHPLYFLTISGLANLLMNIIFVVCFKMGVAGVALATVISQVLSAIMIIIYQLRQNDCVRLDPKALRIHMDKLKKIIIVGIPAGLQGSVFSLSNVVIQSSINSFGAVVMAANGAASSLEGFTYTAMNSVHHAALTFVGQNVGAHRYERINRVVFTCLAIVTVLGILIGWSMYFFGEPLLKLYLPNDPEAIPYGITRLSYIALTHFLCGCMDVMVGGQRGLGMSVTPMLTSLLGSCVLRIVWINTIFAANRTLFMLYISYPISWIITFAAHMIFYLLKLRKVRKQARAEGWMPESVR